MAINRAVQLGQFAGIRLAVHPLCLLYLPLGAMLLAWGPLTDESDNGGALSKWLMACVAVLLMAVSVFLHELGHLVTAVHYKIPVRQSILYPFGGIVQLGSTPIPFLPFASMLLAGPFVSLWQAFIWFGIWWWWDLPLYLWLAQFNLFLALLNVLPIFRLDGGRLLRLLQHSFLPAQMTALVGFLISVYLALGFTLSGGVAVMFGLFLLDRVLVIGGVLLVLTGLLIQVGTDHVMLPFTAVQIKELERTPVAQLCTQLSARSALEKLRVDPINGRFAQNEVKPPVSLFADTNGTLPQAEKTAAKQLPTLRPWLVHPTTSLLQALHRMDSARASTLLLVEGSQIIDTITHNQILQYLTAQGKSLPPRSTNLFMLLKSKAVEKDPFYLS